MSSVFSSVDIVKQELKSFKMAFLDKTKQHKRKINKS